MAGDFFNVTCVFPDVCHIITLKVLIFESFVISTGIPFAFTVTVLNGATRVFNSKN